MDATVRVFDYADARIGTALAPRLLGAARRAAADAIRASAGPLSNEELEACLVAVLTAHAAVEAAMNEVGEVTDAAWWANWQPKSIDQKWSALVERRRDAEILEDDPGLLAVKRLQWDKNQVAHFRGLRQLDNSYEVAGPPVEDRGGISPLRAYFDARRASDRKST